MRTINSPRSSIQEKIKEQLVKQLPFLAKFIKLDSSGQDGDSSEDRSDATDPDVGDSTVAKNSSSEDETGEIAASTDAAAKKKRLIIGIAAALAVVALLSDTEEETSKKDGAVKEQVAKKSDTPKIEPNRERPIEAQTPPETAPEEKTPIATIPEETATTAPREITPIPETIPDISGDRFSTTPDVKIDVPGEEIAPSGTGEVAKDENENPIMNPVPTAPSEDSTEDILKDLEKTIKKDETPKEQVAPQYVAPPDYGNSGRGLVYNCKGKHWACIDAPSFTVCQQNFSFLSNNNKRKECVPNDVYQNSRDCSTIQQQKIVSNTKTDFCGF